MYIFVADCPDKIAKSIKISVNVRPFRPAGYRRSGGRIFLLGVFHLIKSASPPPSKHRVMDAQAARPHEAGRLLINELRCRLFAASRALLENALRGSEQPRQGICRPGSVFPHSPN